MLRVLCESFPGGTIIIQNGRGILHGDRLTDILYPNTGRLSTPNSNGPRIIGSRAVKKIVPEGGLPVPMRVPSAGIAKSPSPRQSSLMKNRSMAEWIVHAGRGISRYPVLS